MSVQKRTTIKMDLPDIEITTTEKQNKEHCGNPFAICDLPNAHGHIMVVCGAGPQCYPEKALANRHNHTTYFVLILESFSNTGQHLK